LHGFTIEEIPMIRHFCAAGLAVGAIALLPAPAIAQRAWETIGSRNVDGGVDRATINVRGNERFRAVRICAQRRPVRVLGANVDFANGGSQDLNATSILSAGECSRPIDLRGKARDITRVRMTYAKFRVFSRAPRVIVQAR
jgi:hypothetical protein